MLAAIATGYWYFFARAGATLNKSSVNSLTSGLVGYWTFDGADISGTTATDRSGSGNNGTLTNGPTKAIGKIGQALNFDGSDDYIGWGAYTTEQTTYTAVLWFKYIDASTTGALFFRGDLNTCAYNPSVLIASGTLNARESGCSGTGIIGSQALTPGWHHVAVTRSGQTAILYFDGVSVATDTSQSTGNFSSGYFSVGASSTNGNPPGFEFFNSSIDEVRVYNRTLSAEEVKSLYNLGSADKVNTSVSQLQGAGRLDSGLAGYWKLDTTSGISAVDSSTNANNGTLTNMEDPGDWVTGQIGNALDFDGVNEYVNVVDTDALDFSDGQPFTLTGWFYRDTFVNDDYLVAKSNGSGAQGYGVLIPGFGDLMNFFVNDGTDQYTIEGVTAIQSTGWHHFAAVWGETSASLYIDGQLDNGVTTGTISSVNSLANAVPFRLGIDSDGDDSLDGKLDEIRVYNRALSADEVSQLYRLTTPTGVDTSLKGYWSFNGSDINGTTAYDRSGSRNDGTLTNGPTKAIGKIGQGLSFDFVNDVVTTSQAISGSISATTATLSAWVKPGTQYDTSGVPFNLGCIICDSGGYIGIYRGSYAGIGHDAIVVANYSGSDYFVEANSTAVNTREWAHIVLVHSGGILSAYSNGVFIGSVSSGNTSNLTGSWKIGSTNFNGTIDEVRIYNRALSAGEVKSLYDLGASDKMNTSASQPQGTGRLDSGLAGYWKLDENTGTNAADASTNGNAGTLTNGPTWTTGKIGSAIDFDGTDDQVSIPDTDSLDMPNSFSVSAWIRPDLLSGYRNIVVKNCGGTDTNYTLETFGSELDFGYSDAIYYTSGVGLQTGQWQHVVGTYDWDANLLRIYRDGVQVLTANESHGVPVSTCPVHIGYHWAGEAFDGRIDDVRIYNRALSADEIADLYRLTTPTGVDTGLKGYWSFNGSDINGTTAYDRSGSGNNGTLTNGPTRAIGKIGQALSFDGGDDRVDIGTSAAFDNLNTKTVSAWIKPVGLTEWRAIVGRTHWSFQICSNDATDCNGTSGHLVYYHTFSGTDGKWRLGANSVTENQWAHVVVIYDRTSTANDPVIYVNGVSQTVTEISTPTGTADSETNDLAIGYDGYVLASGIIDDVRIYNRALAATEIAALYNQGR